ncbi:hypothetical protein QBC46DRAFT_62466 [Diplogelasinospora grovesii]|uniref:Zn(2)-C6 fungal-type domain-containing protein n=1 Tax=Diplogelasinospora grovesii TaxID=303347 RepID=A0AAN6NLM0_9PEZI|nr:hypothetical protein QBC46DRAFT_62466 [Diplogelasinospora grovesii]
MAASVTKSLKMRTACDRCYELKERCERATTSGHCVRCDRLGLTCSTVRPVRPAGRRPHHKKHPATGKTWNKSRKPEQCQLGIDSWLGNIPDLQPEEKELLMFLLSQPRSLDYYVVCPSFQAEQQQSLTIQLPAALSILKDAYLACAISLKQLQSGIAVDANTSISVRHISTAMSTLRSLPVSGSQDAVLCHTLGSALALSIYSTVGVGVPEICRYCLSTTSPFVGTANPGKHDDPWQSFLILLETIDCLIHRQKPTQRIQLPSSAVDHRLGLCLPLLPYYYDLCVISNSLINTTETSILARLQKQLDHTHAALETWQPSHPDQLVEQFDSAEIVNLLAQAKAYRLGALLVSHRLRYPFGQEDGQADVWSKEVMMELDLAQRVTKRSMRFVTLPFMVAAVEIRDASLRIKTLQHVDDYVDHFAPVLQKAMKTFLSRVWRERDVNLTSRWFDSMHKPCPVLHSIDATLLW